MHTMDFIEAQLPSSYLGIPLFQGLNRKQYYNEIIERLKSSYLLEG